MKKQLFTVILVVSMAILLLTLSGCDRYVEHINNDSYEHVND